MEGIKPLTGILIQRIGDVDHTDDPAFFYRAIRLSDFVTVPCALSSLLIADDGAIRIVGVENIKKNDLTEKFAAGD